MSGELKRMVRTFHMMYEVDVDAETVAEAVKLATQLARDRNAIATWSVESFESNLGTDMPEITGLASLLPTGEVEEDLNA